MFGYMGGDFVSVVVSDEGEDGWYGEGLVEGESCDCWDGSEVVVEVD